MRTKAPCKDCTEREVGCHGRCERYKAWRKDLDEKNRRERLQKQATKYPVIIYSEDKKE